jgi:phosphatidylserine/phosphatidylglycerophosphate/cardiolipin synthase-like enzyme
MIKYILLICCLCSFQVNAISIAEARRQPVGSVATITGVVLNGSEFGSQRFIDDGTDAVCVFSSLLAGVLKGDNITVQGTVDDYHSLIEVINLTQFTVNSGNNPLPPLPVLFPYHLKESYEGRLVQLRNVYINGAAGTFAGNTGYELTDGSSTATLYIKSGTSLVGQPIPAGRINVTGIGSQYDNTYELFPRTSADISNAGLYIEETPSLNNITSSGFDVNWQTNAAASSELRYGHTPFLELGVLSGTGGLTTHDVSIAGTNASEIFYFQCVSVSGSDTAESPVMMGITASAVPGNIKVYFNRTVNTTVALPGNNAAYVPGAFADSIAALINSAQHTVDVCIYSFSSFNVTAIINAVNNAFQNGKQVRIIYDGNNASPGISQLINNIPKLSSPVADYNYNICHNKFVVIDGGFAEGRVITGSTNFTDGQLNEDANNLVVVNDQSLSKVYTMEFEEMWGSNAITPNPALSRFGYYKRDNTPHQLMIGNINVESYFSPSDNVNYAIRESIISADYSLYIALLLFTKIDVSTTLLPKISGGITFAGIVDDTSGTTATGIFNNIYNMAGSNMQIYAPVNSEILHHKYMIVDQNTSSDPLVLTGSHNWTLTAENSNDENTLVIHDALIANQYYQEFYRRMQDNGIVLENPEIKTTEFNVYPVPADDALHIVFKKPAQDLLKVYDMQGQIVNSILSNGFQTIINTENLPSGIYHLHSENSSRSIRFSVCH